MKSTQKLGLVSVAVVAMTVGAVVSLGGGKLFETGGSGGWFSGLLSSDAVQQAARPTADTRLAEQNAGFPISEPISGQEDVDSALSRMASLPYVSAQDALSGAVAGNAAGMAQLQAYLDAAGFDANTLEERADVLFSALEDQRDLSFTRKETRSAARRIVSAARLTSQSAFLFPAVLYDDYTLSETVSGWDVGPLDKTAYSAFKRLSSDDPALVGDGLEYYQDDTSSRLLSDGATQVSSIQLPNVLANTRNANLRLFALSATQREEGAPYPLPFGYSISSYGKPYRIVDGRKATSSPWVSLGESDIALHTTQATIDMRTSAQTALDSAAEDAAGIGTDAQAEEDAVTDDRTRIALSRRMVEGRGGLTLSQASSEGANQAGAILSVPVTARNGRITLNIDQLRGQISLVNGFILAPDGMAPALARIAERARGLEQTGALVAGVSRPNVTSAPQAPRTIVPLEPTGFIRVPTVDYPEALAGALSGSTRGVGALSAYLDAAGGDLQRLENRAMALIEGLEARTRIDDFLTLAEAANRITDATAKAASTTYLMNGFIGRDFDLPDPEAGWDFGDEESLPYSGFERTANGSRHIIGANARPGANPVATPLVKDFISRIEGLRFELPSAYYRVIMLVAPSAGSNNASPLGKTIAINGDDQRLRDLRASDPKVWTRLAGGSISLHGGLESYGPVDPRLEDMLEAREGMATLKELFMRGGVFTQLPSVGQDIDPSQALSRGQSNALVYASRAFVNSSGGMVLDFPDPPQGGTVLGAIIQGESNPEPLAESLAERIAQLLGSTSPAAGVLLDDVLPAAGTFFSSAFNLPTQVAANLNGQTRYVNGTTIGPVGGGGLGTLAATDTGVTDAGGTDTGGTDTGGTDTGGTDTGGTDTGGTDTGGTDTGGTDTGGTDTGGTDTGGTDAGGTDTGGTDTGGTDTGGTDTGGTDTGGTDTGGTDTGGTDTGGTDTGGTDTGGTDTGGTDTGGTDTGGTDTGGTDTGGTDTGGTDTGGTDTGGTDTGGTDTGGTDTGGTDTGGTDTGGTDTGGTDTGGTDTGGTDTGGTDTGGTDTGGTDTGGTDTGGTDTGGTDTGGTDTGGTDIGGTDTGGTDTGGTDTGGTDTGGTDTGGTDTGGTDTGGTDTGGTDTGGTDTGGTDTGGTDTGGTDTGGTDTGGTDTGGTDTGGTDTGGTDTGGTDTGGTDTGGTDTGGTDTGGTDTGGTDTGGTDTGGTDTGGTDTGGTDTGGTDTGGTDTGGTDTGGTDTGGTDTGGTDTGGTDTGGTDTGGTDTGGTDTGGTDTGGTDTGGTDTGGTDTGGTDTGGTDTGGTDTGGTDTGGTDTGGTDTGGTDTGGTDTGGTDTGGTDTGGTDTGGTDTGGTDTGGTDTGGTDTGGTDTGGTDTGGTDTGGTDTGGTDTGGTDTGGTDTGGTDTGGTDTGGTDTGGTDTGGTDTGGTDTGGTDTGGTDTGGTDTGGTDTGGTDTGGTDTGGTDTGGTDTGGTDTGGTDTGGTDTGGTDTGGTDTGGTDTGGTDTGGTDTGGTDTGGTDTGGTDTGGTDTGGTDTGGTDTGGTDTGGTDTGGTDTGGTDTGGTDTGGTDTGGTDTGGTDTGGTDTGGTDTGGTDTGGTDTGGTDTGGTDTGGTDTGGTDTGGTDTGGTDTGGTDTGGTDTGGTDTGGTDTGGTDTGGTDTGGTDTGGTDTGGTDTGGTDTGGTDTGGTDTGGTDTGGTDTGGTDTGGTDTGGTDTGGTDTGGTDTGGTDTGGTDTGGTDTGGTDTGGTDTGGTDTGGTDTGGTDTGGTDTGGTDGGSTDGGELVLRPDAGGPYRVLVDEEFLFDGSGSMFNIGLDEFDIQWILFDAGVEVLQVTGLGVVGSPFDPALISLDTVGIYDVILSFTFGDLIVTSNGVVIVTDGTEIPVPAGLLIFLPGLIGIILLRRRR